MTVLCTALIFSFYFRFRCRLSKRETFLARNIHFRTASRKQLFRFLFVCLDSTKRCIKCGCNGLRDSTEEIHNRPSEAKETLGAFRRQLLQNLPPRGGTLQTRQLAIHQTASGGPRVSQGHASVSEMTGRLFALPGESAQTTGRGGAEETRNLTSTK